MNLFNLYKKAEATFKHHEKKIIMRVVINISQEKSTWSKFIESFWSEDHAQRNLRLVDQNLNKRAKFLDTNLWMTLMLIVDDSFC